MEEQSDDLESEDQDIEETEKTELNKEEQTEDLESEDQETEITEQANDENKECLQVCLETRNLNSPQHRCHTCAKPVSTICHCNIQAMSSTESTDSPARLPSSHATNAERLPSLRRH